MKNAAERGRWEATRIDVGWSDATSADGLGHSPRTFSPGLLSQTSLSDSLSDFSLGPQDLGRHSSLCQAVLGKIGLYSRDDYTREVD